MMIHNFNSGPAALPKEVFKKAARGVINFKGSKMSILEISHRSNAFEAVMSEARALVKELLGVPDGYSVLFLQGGASLQFLMVPYNLLRLQGRAAYVNTGAWSTKAIKEAKIVGSTEVIASSEAKNFSYIPKGFNVSDDYDYLHLTSNNTIFGTQYKDFPESPVPLVCDMSSDILSRKINVADFALIYAGAQKNMGPAGATMVIVKDDLLGKTGRKIPSMLDYKIQIDNGSMYNTPATFSVYVVLLTLQWLKSQGGVERIEKNNNAKAALLYREIDKNPLFSGTASVEDRSLMNVTFVLKNQSHEEEFDKMIKGANLIGLKGHRSVGGYRASLYNAVSLRNVKALVRVMRAFKRKMARTPILTPSHP